MTQQQALEILKTGQNVFLTGEPGSGKTYTINLFTEWLKEQALGYAITASTGIAATHINGSTIHSWSGIGIKRKLDELDLDTIKYKKFVSSKIRDTDVLIIDEVSMLDSVMIDNVHKVLSWIKQNDEPFGGIQVVFVGDFFQLPPVSREGALLFAFEAEAWKNAELKVCYLTEQHRQSDPRFLEILTAMRTGKITDAQKEVLLKCLLSKPPATHLYTHNIDVENLNKIEFNKLPGETRTFKAKTFGLPWMVENLKKNCLSPDLLELKEGAVVMFTSNNFQRGYVNGTIGIILGFDSNGEPRVKLKTGEVIVPVYREWKIEEKERTVASFQQLPLRLAWAITVHKSQGMSLDEASVDLSKTFEYGQGYVAISRVRSLEGLHLQGINDQAFEVNPKIMEQDLKFRKESNDFNK
jgi:ATP-dependent DNA helicase PIF1